jgi:hypothetical protein
MRISLLALATSCVACSATGPRAVPPNSIAGTWNQTSDLTPGGNELGLVIAESGTTVSGTAARPGLPTSGLLSYRVSGQYRRPLISLTFVPLVNGQPVAGESFTYTGHAVDTNTIVLNGFTMARSAIHLDAHRERADAHVPSRIGLRSLTTGVRAAPAQPPLARRGALHQ